MKEEEQTLRTCSHCLAVKPPSEFYKDGTRNGIVRYRPECKECYKQNRVYVV